MSVIGRLIRVDEVAKDQRDQMFALMHRHYENMQRDEFEHDLEEKHWVIIAERSDDGVICGFSTQMLIPHLFKGENIQILFSGDTIVDPDYWGRNPLAQVWGRMVLTLIDQNPNAPLYWFLIAKGYKTYRFLPVFFHEFYPRFDRVTPEGTKQLIGSIARARYPDRFDEIRGIIRADASSCRLRTSVGKLTPQRLSDPHVKFFCQCNPGHASGDELCCIAKLTRDNLNGGAYRVIGEQKRVVLYH